MKWLDDPVDPQGCAVTELCSDKPFKYCCMTVQRTFYTNSRRRWRRHYRLCKRRNRPGTWLQKDDTGVYAWSRMILSENWG